jgi:hypothetical protein
LGHPPRTLHPQEVLDLPLRNVKAEANFVVELHGVEVGG